MKHYGDITKISGYTAPVVDIITGGSPCQDLSVAGKRAGLAGERSGLFMEQMRIIREMREKDARDTGRTGWAIRPRYMVWENVPGAFSSGKPKGADFAAVIEEIIKVAEPGAAVDVCVPDRGWTKSGCYYAEDGSWSIAWRLHDAQFWGVPQRRKRIALVADFGGLSAPEILFERKGLRWDSEQSAEEGQGTAEAAGSGAESAVYGIDHVITKGGNCTAQGPCVYKDVEATLKAAGPHAVYAPRIGAISAVYGIDKAITTGGNCTAGGDCVHEEYAPSLTTDRPHAVAYGVVGKGNGEAYLTEERHTSLSTGGGEPGQGYPCVMSFQERAGKPGGGKGILIQHEHVGALSTLNNQSVLDNRCWSLDEKMGQTYVHDDMGNTLGARDYKQPQAVYIPIHDMLVATPIVFDKEMYNAGEKMSGVPQARYDNVAPTVRADSHPSGVCKSVVRRLTPLECERLQGFPDNWTNIGEWTDSKGKKHKDADSPRYKALGNSIALPFWAWMARRICAQYERTATMASLFDGIGGFPLVFSRAGAVPVWASEIEEFPIAVTKIRFPEVAT